MLILLTANAFAILLFGLQLLLPAAGAAETGTISFAVVYDDVASTASVLPGNGLGGDDLWHAKVNYTPSLFTDGWDRLTIQAVDRSRKGSFSAGYAEGFATHKSIYTMFQNNYNDWWGDGHGPHGDFTPASTYDWLLKNWNWTKSQVDLHSDVIPSSREEEMQSTFWSWVGTNVDQLEGLVAGYNAAAPAHRALTLGDFLLLNADGDVESLESAFSSQSQTNSSTTPSFRRGPSHLRCSSMWKLADDNSDIFFGHATWDHFDMMVRTLKQYHWGDTVSISMSSSPGFLSSVDDFYLTSRGLSVIETTNGNFNASLWRLLTPSSVLSWMRANVANAASKSALEWTEFFSMKNSGTYNNQWMILDMNKFQPGMRKLAPMTFMILEQLPGSCAVEDKSHHLDSKRYWGSYNVPGIPSVWKESGFGLPSLQPEWEYSHSECPRAVLMRELNSTVIDVESFQKLIRFNKGPTDPNSHDLRAGFGISARFDLVPEDDENYGLGGGIDGKMSSVAMARRMQFYAQNGPTHDNVDPFDWDNVTFPNPAAKSAPKHEGMPHKWQFPWVLFG